MRLMHISDIHFGKKLKEFSLVEDHKHIMDQILNIAQDKKIDALLIAGDIYDGNYPSDEAMKTFENFLETLSEKNIKTYISRGNHDSAVKLSYGSYFIKLGGISISPEYSGTITPEVLEVDDVKVNIYMLPYLKPGSVKQFYPEVKNDDYNGAVETAINNIDINPSEINILMSHQFVKGASESGSESVVVGGLEEINADMYNGFDYVALGHIHSKQDISANTKIRYSGAPLKFNVKEAGDSKKSVTIIDINGKDDITLSEVELTPMRNLRKVTGKFMDVISDRYLEKQNLKDFIYVVLTDDHEIMDAASRLRLAYPNFVSFKYAFQDEKNDEEIQINDLEDVPVFDLFAEFYKKANKKEMTPEQATYMELLIKRLEDEG